MEKMSQIGLLAGVLRCCLLQETDVTSWRKVNLLEDHLDDRKGTDIDAYNKIFLMKATRDLGIPDSIVDAEKIQRMSGILDSNAFEIKTVRGGRMRGLYPFSAMANSSCVPNLTTIVTRAGGLQLVASRDIRFDDHTYLELEEWEKF